MSIGAAKGAGGRSPPEMASQIYLSEIIVVFREFCVLEKLYSERN